MKWIVLFFITSVIFGLSTSRICNNDESYKVQVLNFNEWNADLNVNTKISHSNVGLDLVVEENGYQAITGDAIKIKDNHLDIKLLADYDEYSNPILYGILIKGADICDKVSEEKFVRPSVATLPPPTTPPSSVAPTQKISRIPFNVPDECGITIPEVQPYIHHGTISTAGEFPWHAAIFDMPQYAYRCGGSLISQDMVVTAAHCVTEPGTQWHIFESSIIVVLGKDRLSVSSIVEQKIPVSAIHVHKHFKPNNFNNDIAALKLWSRAEYTNFVRPVCVWPYRNDRIQSIVDHVGLIPGFGYNVHWHLSDYLASVKMPVVSYEACLFSNRNLYARVISETNYCAGYQNGSSVCNGDSGGGMVFKINSLYFLRGIVSIGSPDSNDNSRCNTHSYIVFTDVAKFIDWITELSPVL